MLSTESSRPSRSLTLFFVRKFSFCRSTPAHHCALVWGFIIMLSFLAFRHHRWGYRWVWISSVTGYPFFAGPGEQTGKLAVTAPATPPKAAALPPPVTAKRNVSTRSQRPRRTEDAMPERRPSQQEKRLAVSEKRPAVPEKRPSQSRNHHRRPSATRRDTPNKNEEPTYVYMIPHTMPEPTRVGETARQVRDKYLRDASPRR